MPEKYLCANCLDLVETHVDHRVEEHRVKGIPVHVCADVRICEKCGKEMFDEKLDAETLQKAYAIYREKTGLLSVAEMKRIREQYGMTQTAFAKILGLGEKTITRYESGSIPDEAQNNLIHVCEDPRTFMVLLEKNRQRITQAEYNKATSSVTWLNYSIGSSYSYSVEGGAAQGTWGYYSLPGA